MRIFCTILRMNETNPPTFIHRSLRLRPEERLRVTVEDPQRDSIAHDHLFHEIAYIRSGFTDHQTARGVERLSAGTLIIIRPQVWHGYVNCRGLAVVNCLFNSSVLFQLMPLLVDAPEITNLLRSQSSSIAHATPTVLHLDKKHRQKIELLLSCMLHEQKRKGRAWQSACTADLLHLLAQINRLIKPLTHSALSPATDAAILTAAHHIEAHYTQNVSLAALSAMTGLSKGHLSRHFSARMGMGIIDYQHRLRVEEACRLLRLTDLSITQIAARTGYAEIAYFSRCFRQLMGISARDYRRGRYATDSGRPKPSQTE